MTGRASRTVHTAIADHPYMRGGITVRTHNVVKLAGAFHATGELPSTPLR